MIYIMKMVRLLFGKWILDLDPHVREKSFRRGGGDNIFVGGQISVTFGIGGGNRTLAASWWHVDAR